MAPPSESTSAIGIATGADLQEVPKAHIELFLAQREQPEDRRKRSSNRQIGPKIDANQDRVAKESLGVSGLQRASRDQAKREIVDQVVRNRDSNTRDHRPRSGGQMLCPAQPPARDLERAQALDRIDHNEQAGDERQGAPADLLRKLQRVRSRLDRDRRCNRQSCKAGRQPKVLLQRGGHQQHKHHPGKPAQNQLPFTVKRLLLRLTFKFRPPDPLESESATQRRWPQWREVTEYQTQPASGPAEAGFRRGTPPDLLGWRWAERRTPHSQSTRKRTGRGAVAPWPCAPPTKWPE